MKYDLTSFFLNVWCLSIITDDDDDDDGCSLLVPGFLCLTIPLIAHPESLWKPPDCQHCRRPVYHFRLPSMLETPQGKAPTSL